MRMTMFYLELVQNVGLLVSLVVLHGLIIRRWNKYTLTSQVFSGFLFGCVALIGMMTPVNLMPGLIFDGRSIVHSVAGLFGGPVTAGMAAIMSAAYRLWLGGPGMIMGVSVIFESAGLGVAFYYLRPLYPGLTRNLSLFAFGLSVHVGMLLLTLTLPKGSHAQNPGTYGYTGPVDLSCGHMANLPTFSRPGITYFR